MGETQIWPGGLSSAHHCHLFEMSPRSRLLLWNKGIRHEVSEATAVCGREEGRTHLVLSDRDPWDYEVCLALAEIMSDARVQGTHNFATTTGR